MLKPSERLTWCERKAAAIGAVVQLELKLENFMIEKMEKFYDLKKLEKPLVWTCSCRARGSWAGPTAGTDILETVARKLELLFQSKIDAVMAELLH